MFKKTLGVLAATSIGMMSSVGMAKETDLLLTGIFQGSASLEGTPVKMKLSYDSETPPDYMGDPNRGDYRLLLGNDAVSFSIEIGDKLYYPEMPYGSTVNLNVTIENYPGMEDVMRIEFPHPLRAVAGNENIDMISLSLALNDRESNTLPDSASDFKVPTTMTGPTSSFQLSTHEGSGSVFLTGFYDQLFSSTGITVDQIQLNVGMPAV